MIEQRSARPVPHQPLAPPLPARAGTRTVTAEWLVGLPTNFGERPALAWLDDTHLVYTLPSAGEVANSSIDLLNVEAGATSRLGDGTVARPSPDGQSIAFTRTLDGVTQLWLMRRDGTGVYQLSHLPGGLNGYAGYQYGYAWSPDSSRLAFFHQPYVPYWDRDRQQPGDESVSSAVDGEHLRTEPPSTTIEIIDTSGGETRTMAVLDEQIRDLSWLADGEQLIFMSVRHGHDFGETTDRAWVQSMRVADGRIIPLATFGGLQQSLQPAPSPDGTQVAFTYDADNPRFNYLCSIGLASTQPDAGEDAPPIRRLTHELKLNGPQWSLDGTSLYAIRDHGAYKQIYAIDAATGEATQITTAPLTVESYALSPNGIQLAWIGQDAHGTRILRVATSDGRDIRDLVVIPSAPPDLSLSEVREIDWAVTDYPARMRGLVILPLDYHPGKRYPLIVDIHGGGPGARISLRGGVLSTSPLEWQLWAAKGYAVFVPEFRSSASFGQLAITRDYKRDHDLINRDIGDIVAGVDTLIADGLVDPACTAVIGLSAGARRANWLTVATHRFRTVVSIEGWADEWLLAGVNPLDRITDPHGGPPVLVPEAYQKNSALFHARGATTPTLFLMGNPRLGGVDRHDTVRWLYNALKSQGVETQYLLYPDEGHGFLRPANRQDALQRVTNWIDRHLGLDRSR